MASTGLGAKGTFPQSVRSLGILRGGQRRRESIRRACVRAPGCVGCGEALAGVIRPFQTVPETQKSRQGNVGEEESWGTSGESHRASSLAKIVAENKGRRDGRNQPRLIVSMVVVMLEREGIHLQRATGGKTLGALAWAPDGNRTGQRGLGHWGGQARGTLDGRKKGERNALRTEHQRLDWAKTGRLEKLALHSGLEGALAWCGGVMEGSDTLCQDGLPREAW